MNPGADRVSAAAGLLATLGRNRLPFVVALLALPLAYLFAASGGVPFSVALAAMAVFCFVVMSAGMLLLRAAGAAELPAAAAWVLGVFATGIVVYALVELLRIPAFECFALWALLVLALGVVAARRGEAPGARLGYQDMLGLLLCAAVTVMWCRGIAAAPAVLDREGLLPAWVDYFIHGGVISQFGDARSVAHLSYDLADFPMRFYHYASYQLPAAFAEALDQPGLPLATSVWLPLGFLTMCAGACALGVALAGPPGGLIAVAALSLIPDAASYGLRNSLFGYHWNILAIPGSGYALGIALLSVAFLHRYVELRSSRALLAGALLAAGTVLFRANVFVLAFPAWLAAAGISLTYFQRRRLLYAVVLIGFVASAAMATYIVADNATGWHIAPALEPFLDEVHLNQEPTAYTGWYRRLTSYGSGIAVPAGILLVFPACLGAFVLLYPAALLIARRRLSAIDSFPPFLVAFYVVLMTQAPIPPHGDATELTHRPFVLLYAVIVIWTVTMLADRPALQGEHGAERLWRMSLLAALAGVAAMWNVAPDLGHLKAAWGRGLESYVAEEGTSQSAVFLRRKARPGDIFAVSGTRLDVVPTDVATQLASLTGLAAYIARPFIQIVSPGPREELARRRHADLLRVERQASTDSALALLRELGIQWYVFVGSEGPGWDRDRRRAAFVDGRIAVYSSAQR